jgi:hypothetical protein
VQRERSITQTISDQLSQTPSLPLSLSVDARNCAVAALVACCWLQPRRIHAMDSGLSVLYASMNHRAQRKKKALSWRDGKEISPRNLLFFVCFFLFASNRHQQRQPNERANERVVNSGKRSLEHAHRSPLRRRSTQQPRASATAPRTQTTTEPTQQTPWKCQNDHAHISCDARRYAQRCGTATFAAVSASLAR